MQLTTIMRDGDRISIQQPPQQLLAATQRLYRNRIVAGYMLRPDPDFMSHPAKNNDTPHKSGQREADTSQPLSADHVCRLLKIGLEPLRGEKEPLSDSDALQGQMEPTPGPWQVAYWLGQINGDSHEALAIWPADIVEPFRGDPICLVSNAETEDAQDHANARLIAAAPDLLQFAKAVCDALDNRGNVSPMTASDGLRIAIDRAEGRTP